MNEKKKKLEKVLWVPTGTLAVSKRVIAATTKITQQQREQYSTNRARERMGAQSDTTKKSYMKCGD